VSKSVGLIKIGGIVNEVKLTMRKLPAIITHRKKRQSVTSADKGPRFINGAQSVNKHRAISLSSSLIENELLPFKQSGYCVKFDGENTEVHAAG